MDENLCISKYKFREILLNKYHTIDSEDVYEAISHICDHPNNMGAHIKELELLFKVEEN